MTRFDRLIRSALSWWRCVHPDRSLERIPAYAAAVRDEKAAKASGSTQAIHRARERKGTALHRSLAAGCGREWR